MRAADTSAGRAGGEAATRARASRMAHTREVSLKSDLAEPGSQASFIQATCDLLA